MTLSREPSCVFSFGSVHIGEHNIASQETKHTATVLNVQRYTLHDGPGIRTEFFLKGCPLRCQWCGNPESFARQPQVGVYSNKCLGLDICGDCVSVCSHPASLRFSNGQLAEIDRTHCDGCFNCVAECPSDAIKAWGEPMSVDQCMALIRKDVGFFRRSGGGVTVSGGEPLLQSEFVLELFKACKHEGIHTCLESSMHANWLLIEKLLPYTDLFISDIKLMDSSLHKRYTGVGNHKILTNLARLSTTNKPIILRIPVIPTINDDLKNAKASAEFIQAQMCGRVQSLQLLSFMRLGEEKYRSLGLDYPMAGLEFEREAFQQKVAHLADYFNQQGIRTTVGSKELG